MITKVTEYQAITFLKYDQLHESLRKQFGSSSASRSMYVDSGDEFHN